VTHASTQTAASPSHPVERLLVGLDQPVGRVAASPGYVLGLCVVACVVVLLPLVYIGLIALVGYGVYYHVTEHYTILQGRLHYARLLAYLGPIIVGPILVAFMIKPLLAGPAGRERRITLLPEHEPALFTFVWALCAALRAPKPRRIDIGCDINAAAFFRRGWLSLFGRDLVLWVGAPLVAGLTLRQFAGVLAHELGHFSQGVGMRLHYVITSVNRWFARVVYDRDKWDDALNERIDRDDSAVSLVLVAAKLCIWLTRRLLWLLMIISHGLSCLMVRQMEYHADLFEAHVAGGEALEQTIHRMALLNAAAEKLASDLEDAWRLGRLPDNYPELLVVTADSVPPAVREYIRDEITSSRTGLFDTHPSDAARIRRCRRANEPGIYRVERPATSLFSDFALTAKEITFAFYVSVLGTRVSRDRLVPTEQQTRKQKDEQASLRAARRYFGRAFSPLRPLRPPSSEGLDNLPTERLVEELCKKRDLLAKSAKTSDDTHERYAQTWHRELCAQIARACILAKLPFEPGELELDGATMTEVHASLQRMQAERDELVKPIQRMEACVVRRLQCGLALLSRPQVRQKLPSADKLRRRAARLVRTIEHLADVREMLGALRLQHGVVVALARAVADEASTDTEDLVHRVLQQSAEQVRLLSELRNMLSDSAYPYQEKDGSVDIAQFAIGQLPGHSDLGEVVGTSSRAIDTLDNLYSRVIGELARIAEAAESAVGLPRLPDPTED
jgi:hypothetical protein